MIVGAALPTTVFTHLEPAFETGVRRDASVRRQGRLTLPPGAELTLVARATDGSGALQPEEFRLPQPDGSTGWHHAAVKAG